MNFIYNLIITKILSTYIVELIFHINGRRKFIVRYQDIHHISVAIFLHTYRNSLIFLLLAFILKKKYICIPIINNILQCTIKFEV